MPKEFLTALELSPGDTLYASETENGIALTAHDPEFEAQMALAEEIIKYLETLSYGIVQVPMRI